MTEDNLVQQTTADYLHRHLGWESVYAYNTETFGPAGTLGRISDREVVLTRYLRQKLAEFNPGLPEVAYDDAIRQIMDYSTSQSTLATNREKHLLLRDGVQVQYRNAKGELVKQRLRIFDFTDSSKNHFLVVRELWIKGDLYRRRADLVGFVNGLPLIFIECKNVHKNLHRAFEENIKDYKDTIPTIFHHNSVDCSFQRNPRQARIGVEHLQVLSRMETPGGERKRRRGHGDAAQRRFRQTDAAGPVRKPSCSMRPLAGW